MTAVRSHALVAALLATTLLLNACGGGGSSSAPVVADPPPASTAPPDDSDDGDIGVDAGYGRIVLPGASVSLSASVTGGDADTVSWSQSGGTGVTLQDDDTLTPSFNAPETGRRETLAFEITATDGGTTATDGVLVEIWVPDPGDDDGTQLGDFSTRSGWTCDQDPTQMAELTIRDLGDVTEYYSNGLPPHGIGTFPNDGNPNTVGIVYETWHIPNNPVRTSAATTMATFGITLDGLKLERDTAERYSGGGGTWSYEAITPGIARGDFGGTRDLTWLGTDCNNAHVQPTGSYHYHGLPETLINKLGEGPGGATDMILGGYAADGFPFYLRYGYSDPDDASSGLMAMQGSWVLRSGTRPSGPGGVYDGTFREDWEFVEGAGHLDQCNGRHGVTPEHPGGTYHYYLTDDYPYIPRCVFGTPDPSFRVRRD